MLRLDWVWFSNPKNFDPSWQEHWVGVRKRIVCETKLFPWSWFSSWVRSVHGVFVAFEQFNLVKINRLSINHMWLFKCPKLSKPLLLNEDWHSLLRFWHEKFYIFWFDLMDIFCNIPLNLLMRPMFNYWDVFCNIPLCFLVWSWSLCFINYFCQTYLPPCSPFLPCLLGNVVVRCHQF